MATSRCAGGTSLTQRPSMYSSPPLASSRPAISRSSVDLPQPDGPMNTQNSPGAMVRLMSAKMGLPPKRF